MHVAAENTLVLHGPLSCVLIEGRASCLGGRVEVGSTLTVRRFRTLPLHCLCDGEVEVYLGFEAFLEKVEGSTIPSGWIHASDVVTSVAMTKPTAAVVVGGVDVGKTSLTTYLVNAAISAGLRVGVIDGDVGQSDVGPPTTVGSLLPKRPIFDLSSELPNDVHFVGVTSPAKAKTRLITTLASASTVMRSKANITVINTDGWIDGEEAEDYKLQLVKATNADAVVVLQRSDELNKLTTALASAGILTLAAGCSSMVRERSREERKALREQAYAKCLKDSRLRILSLRHVNIRGRPSWDKGRIVALFDSGGGFLQIAVVEDANVDKQLLRLRTSTQADVAQIECSEVALHDGRESINHLEETRT
ncbi:MAG: Clp1/GlmU family protein [Candidatus Bathyarchaeia archaeon]